MHRIVLASTSPYRQALLKKLGVPFTVAKPLLDEEAAKEKLQQRGCTPLEMAQSLARLKAESLQSEDSLVIGGDQLIQLGGHVLGKPHTDEKAVEQLMSMAGKTHEIITAVCLSTPQEKIAFHDIARLTMKPLSRAEIQDYVHLDQPLDCAGSYKIEKNGRSLFSQIEAHDFSAIEGLPLIQLASILQNLGYETKTI